MDRDIGKSRMMVVDDLKASAIGPLLRDNLAKEAILMTDDYPLYRGLGKDFAEHRAVRHKMGEYVNRRSPDIHTNTIEGYFSISKRGMQGVYQHCGRQHLHRYAVEFEFRYNHRTANRVDDTARAAAILKSAEGKRLTYRRPDARASA